MTPTLPHRAAAGHALARTRVITLDRGVPGPEPEER